MERCSDIKRNEVKNARPLTEQFTGKNMLRTFEKTNLNFTNAESTDLIKYLNTLKNCTIYLV